MPLELYVDSSGQIRCLYSEAIDLSVLGTLSVIRASHVEPDANGNWWADQAPVHGPKLGPYPRRSTALEAEAIWLTKHMLHAPA